MRNEQNNLREFGNCRLDVDKKLLWAEDRPVNLPLKAVEVLCILVKGRGAVVTKEEIWHEVWNDSFVEETNLTHNIYMLRKALRELGHPKLIETVPRRGYRFCEDVRDAASDSIVLERHALTHTTIEFDQTDEPNTRHRHSEIWTKPFVLVSALACLCILMGGAAIWRYGFNASQTKPAIHSLAVLPLNSINTEDKQTGLGFADLLITRLSDLKHITIRPLSSVADLDGNGSDPLEIARKLGVDAVLEGTIYNAGDRTRVTLRLLQTSDGNALWSGRFEQSAKDAMRMQNEISLQVADALALDLTNTERTDLTRPLTLDPDALALYQRGRLEWNKRSFQGSAEAERLFRNAIEKDPSFTLAYVGLADTIAMRTDATEAYNAVRKAIEMDPGVAEAHATLGFLLMFHEWDWKGSEAELKRSIDLNPNYATAHHWYAILLEIEGRNAEARAEFERALEINPVSYNFLADLGQAYYFDRDYDKAKEYCRKALDIYPDFIFAHDHLFKIYLQTGETDAAVEENLSSNRIGVSFANTPAEERERVENRIAADRAAFHDAGLEGYFVARLERTKSEAPSYYYPATIYAFIGEKEKALDSLEKAFDNKESFSIPFVKADPVFDKLRDEPRYKRLLEKMNL